MSLDDFYKINRRRTTEFTMVKKDKIFHNLNSTQTVKVPVYPEEPPVNGGGQLYYNSNTECLNYSNSVTWVCVHDGSKISGNLNVNDITANNITIVGNTDLCNDVYINCEDIPLPVLNWSTRVDGSGSDKGFGITSDSENVYGTGYYNAPRANIYHANGTIGANLTSTAQGAYIVKWDSDGTVIWATKVDGPSTDSGFDISFDSGSIYGTGSFTTSANVYNANGSIFGNLTGNSLASYIVKWNSDGITQWITKVDGNTGIPPISNDEGFGISANSGNIYGTGYYNTFTNIFNANGTIGATLLGNSFAAYIAKWNSDGVVQWATKVDGTSSEGGYNIYSDSINVYATGNYNTVANIYNANGSIFGNLTSSGGDGAFIVKWNSEGIAQWATKIDGSLNDQGRGIVSDSVNVYGTGYYNTVATIYNANGSVFDNLTATNDGAYIVKWNSSGVVQWATKIDGTGVDSGSKITFYNEYIYTTGIFSSSVIIYNSDNTEFTTITGTVSSNYIIKYNDDGYAIWIIVVDNSVDSAVDISINNSGDIYVTGSYNGASSITLFTDQLTNINLGSLISPTSTGAYIIKITEIEQLLQFTKKNANAMLHICSNTKINSDLTVTGKTTLETLCVNGNLSIDNPVVGGNVIITIGGIPFYIAVTPV